MQATEGYFIPVQLRHLEIGDIIESHDGLQHRICSIHEHDSGFRTIGVDRSDGTHYDFYNRPSLEVKVIA